MSFIEQYNNAKNATFAAKVRVALISRALGALREEQPVAARVAMAKRIILDPDSYVGKACEILSIQGLTAGSSDEDIIAAISQLTDLFANTFAE